MNISFKKLLLILLILILIYILPRSPIQRVGRNILERYPEFDKLNQFTKLDENPPFINDWEFTINSDTIIYKNGINLFDKWSIVEDPTDSNKLLFNYNAKLKSLSLKVNNLDKNDFTSLSLSDEQKKVESNFNYNDNNVYSISYIDNPSIKKIKSNTTGNIRYYDKPIKINDWYITVDSDNNLIFNYNKDDYSMAIDTNYNFDYKIKYDVEYKSYTESSFQIFTNTNPLIIGNFKFYTIDANPTVNIVKQILLINNTLLNTSIPIFQGKINGRYYFGP